MQQQLAASTVNYSIAAVPENAGLIDAVNLLMIKHHGSGKSAATISAKNDVSIVDNDELGDELGDEAVSANDFKKAAGACKNAHGEEFGLAVLKEQGHKVGKSLARGLANVPEGERAAVMAFWAKGPQEVAGDIDEDLDLDSLLDDDDLLSAEDNDLDLDDDLGEPEPAKVTASAVKAALRALSKQPDGRDVAQAIMGKVKCAKLSDIEELAPDKLEAVMKAVLKKTK